MSVYPTAEQIRRLIDALETQYPDGHADGLNGRGKQIFMAGVMRTGTQPRAISTLLDEENRRQFCAEVCACVAFLTEYDLTPDPTIKPTVASLDATIWARVVAGYNITFKHTNGDRPHVIHPMAFVVAGRHVGLVESVREASRGDIAAHWPTYAITQKQYRKAGFVWRGSALPALAMVKPPSRRPADG